MKELSHLTPYILFTFGLVITYIGWTTKKILENIENAIKTTAESVRTHEGKITKILTHLQIHDFQIEGIKSAVDVIKKTDKIDRKD